MSFEDPHEARLRRLNRFAVLTAAATFFLIFAGGMVTSTGSGLAVPDWPLSFGTLFPEMTGGVFYEHGHRLVAGTVACLTFVLALWLRAREPRAWVRRLGYAACVAVLAQAALGGLTVLLKLPTYVSVSHAGLAQIFCSILVTMALVTGRREREVERKLVLPEASLARPSLRTLTLLTVGAAYAQILLGAVLRHKKAGLAIPDFPLSYGYVVPPLEEPAIKLAFGHRAFALVVAALAVFSVVAVIRRHRAQGALVRPAIVLGLAVLGQVALGAATVLTIRDPHVASAHVVGGAAVLASALVLAIRVRRHLAWPRPKGASRTQGSEKARAFVELTKPRIAFLALVATAAGFYIASGGPVDVLLLVNTVIGAGLVGGGSSALNQVIERAHDARMERTAGRPLPTGRLTNGEALAFGVALSLGGLVWLAVATNAVAAIAGAATLVSYVGVYTPLKRLTSLATVAGAVPGALPPVIGWAAARGEIDLGAWAVFAIVFLWQLPHFLAIAWIYREDYARAGFPTLPGADPAGASTARQIALGCAALLPASLAPAVLGVAGPVYFLGAFVLGIGFLGLGIAAGLSISFGLEGGRAPLELPLARARGLFVGSVVYLPALFALMALDKLP